MSIETVERPVAQEQTFNPPPYPRWFKPLHDVRMIKPGGGLEQCIVARIEKRNGHVEYRTATRWIGCTCGKCSEASMDMDCSVGLWREIESTEAILLIGGAL